MKSKLKDTKDHLKKLVRKKRKLMKKICDVLGQDEGKEAIHQFEENSEILRQSFLCIVEGMNLGLRCEN